MNLVSIFQIVVFLSLGLVCLTPNMRSLKEAKLSNYFCIIPAREGSKRIPNKNIQEVDGVPLIGHVIKNAIASGVFNEIFVSTDSPLIASIALQYGAVVPELRSKELSNDFTPTRPVVADFVAKIPDLQKTGSVIACIYPFAILITPELIRDVKIQFDSLIDTSKYLVAVKRYPHPVQRSFTMSVQNELIPLMPDALESRTQDLPTYFHDAGQFYFALNSTWFIDQTILAKGYGFEISRHSAVDIDDWEDLEELKQTYATRNLEG